MKHVVIGGTGFTGQRLSEELTRRQEEVLVCDIKPPQEAIEPPASFVHVDVADACSVAALPVKPDDVVYHLASRQYNAPVPYRRRGEFFSAVNETGTARVLNHIHRRGCRKFVYFSSDMVYGLPHTKLVDTTHPLDPVGPYGESKNRAESLCRSYREKGLRITILRPRLIIGPGRLGVMAKLFRLIDANLPVPLIGDGSNYYQMISVFDCASAAIAAVESGVPNAEYNLGSEQPRKVRDLLRELVKRTGSHSTLVSTPAGMVKATLWFLDRLGLTLLYREQYAIADVNYRVDISRTVEELGWSPRYTDEDMIHQAYEEYKRWRVGGRQTDVV